MFFAQKNAKRNTKKPKYLKRVWAYAIIILLALNAYLMFDLYKDLTVRIDRQTYQTDTLIKEFIKLNQQHAISSEIHR